MADGGWQKPKFDVRGRIQNFHLELRTLNLGLRFAISAAAIPAQPRSAQPPSAQLLPGRRQPARDDRAAAEACFEAQAAAVGLDDLVGEREADVGAAGLRRIERDESLSNNIRA